MIQRIQSIYLFLAFAGIMTSVVLQSMYWGFNWANSQFMSSDSYLGDALWTIATYIFMIISAVLALSAIFLYKNRGKQILISSVSQLFIVISSAFILKDMVVGYDRYITSYKSLIPLALAFVFLVLAKRRIKHDEELVRAADRIR